MKRMINLTPSPVVKLSLGLLPFVLLLILYMVSSDARLEANPNDKLLPGFDEARVELRELGAMAVGISGSGPTIFALVNDYDVARRVAAWLGEHYKKNERGFVHVCRADLGGARSVRS